MSLIRTNDDATAARNAATKAGYIKDDYVSLFTKKSKSSPIVNRGTALRTTAINSLILNYYNSFKKIQIISLGAGFDTRYFTLESNEIYYWEIDFPLVIDKKIMIMQKNNLLEKLENLKLENGNLTSRKYNLVSGDLRDYVNIIQQLIGLGLDASVPTLILSECCLIYLKESDAILQEFSRVLKNFAFLVYEQMEPNDAFGKMMIKNLSEREIFLFGVSEYPTLDSHILRYKGLGCQDVKAWDMLEALDQLVPKSLVDLWNSLERLDEIEEWNLFCRHYFILFAKK